MKKAPCNVYHVQVGSADWTPSKKQLKAIRKLFKKIMKKHGDVVVTGANIHVQQIAYA
jgi:hypothetical protein